MSVKRLAWMLVAVSVVGAASPASAKKKKAAPAAAEDDEATATDADDDDATPAPKKGTPKRDKTPARKDKAEPKKEARAEKAADGDDSAGDDGDDGGGGKGKKGGKSTDDADEDFKKQDLTGHDLGTKKKTNEFEKDRFYVDKQDSAKTETGTLVQGSIASTSMIYTEKGGAYDLPLPTANNVGTSNSNLSRMFTDLRLQTDFRHIGGGSWDARIDARMRLVAYPGQNTTGVVYPNPGTSTENKIQSGLTGGNEYDIRELWIVRNSARADIFIGRQFIPDLAAVKIDGIRVDYAQSNKFTLLGFGGLFPLRGSRSITTDYISDNFVDAAGTRQNVGRFTGTGGFGAAYRTVNAYGSFGGVVEAPLGGGEQPRIFGTSTGYWRYGTKLDLYHFAVIDLIGTNAQASNFTNISVGANYKPSPRLRLTASFNRVDSETLSVQAGAFLNSADNSLNYIDNEVYLQRLSTNSARGSASAGLGELQRFELTGALSFKYRPDVTLQAIGGGIASTPVVLKAEEGVEVYASLTDRHSIKDARLALDVVQTFGVGSIQYQHTDIFGLRASAAHDIKNGRGEWEAEVAYTKTSDSSVGQTCSPGTLDACFGSAATSMVSVGGTVYYRLDRDWMAMGSAWITRTNIQSSRTAGQVVTDPAITGLTGFFRIAYRF